MTDEEKAAEVAAKAKEAEAKERARLQAKEAEEEEEETDKWETVTRLDRRLRKLEEKRATPSASAKEPSLPEWILPVGALLILAAVAVLDRMGKIKWPTRSP